MSAEPENRPRSAGPAYAQDLDAMECSNPKCTSDHELFFHAKCHPHDGVAIGYEAEMLTVYCRVCSVPVISIKVARATVQ